MGNYASLTYRVKGAILRIQQHPRNAGKLLGVAALAATMLLWGSNHVAARFIRDDISLYALVFWRWTLVLLLLIPFAWQQLRQEKRIIFDNLGYLTLAGITGASLFSLLLNAAAYESPAIEVGLLNATTPIWVLLCALLARQQSLQASHAIGLVLALVGTILIMAKGDLLQLASWSFSRGNIWAIMGAMIFAWYTLLLRYRPAGLSSMVLVVASAFLGSMLVALPVYLGSVLLGHPWLLLSDEAPTVSLAVVAYIAIGPTLIGNFLWIFGVSKIGPSPSSYFLYLSPVASCALAILWLDENLFMYHVVGTALIFVGIGLGQRTAVKA